jgi:hypothetical protein
MVNQQILKQGGGAQQQRRTHLRELSDVEENGIALALSAANAIQKAVWVLR